MKRIILGFLIAILSIPAIAQNNEGSFTININDSKNKNSKIDATSIDFMFKGNKFLIIPKMVAQDAGPSPSIILDLAKKEMILLMNQDGKKSAMIMDMPDISNNEMVKKQKGNPENYKITTTKERKTIEGYETIKVLVEGDDMISELWVTDKVGFDFNEMTKLFGSMAGAGNNGNLPDWNNYGVGGFPLMIIVKDKKGKEEMIMTISNIKKKVDDKRFSLEGYQQMQLKK